MLPIPLQFLLAALGYYLAGVIGLMLAIPPGFASAVWPATGVALFCAIRFQPTVVACAVALAFLTLNLATTSVQFSQITWHTVQPVVFIALGAGSQTLISYVVFKRFLGLNNPIDSPKSIVNFALLVSISASVIAPIIGVSSLYFHGIINGSNVLFNFLTWWSGDSIGVLLFTPLLLTIFSNHQGLTSTRKLQIVLPAIVIFIASWLLFSNSMENKHRLIDNSIRTTAFSLFQKAQESFSISENKLNAYSAFFNASDEVTIHDFNDFSKVILKEDKVFQGIGWTKVVKLEEKEDYIQAIRQSGYPDFAFTQFANDGGLEPVEDKAEYYPVLYIYPLESNRRAFGLDLGANPARLAALKQARVTAKSIATAPIKLIQETEDSWGAILYMPIYEREFDAEDLSKASIDRYFQGYVSGVFRLNGLFESTLNEAHGLDFDLKVTDITDAQNHKIVINSSYAPLVGYQGYSHEVNFGDRLFEIAIFAHDGFKSQLLDWTSWSILTSGFFIASLFQMFILMITGITENTRKQVQLKTHDLRLATKSAEYANQVKSQFLSNMSHELRTPLNAISGFIDISLNTKPSDKVVSSLTHAKQSIATLLTLINRMFEFSNLQKGNVEIENYKFNLNELLEKVASVVEDKTATVVFTIEKSTDVPVELVGDGNKLEKILLAICGNGMKFTHWGEVKLSVSVKASNTQSVELIFNIKDTGIGISPLQQKKIFSGFDQVDNSSTRVYGGSGLGLATSKHLVQLLNGKLTLNSKLQKGSIFTIEIPFQLPTEQSLDANEQSAVRLPEPLKGCSILLVEDNEINQMVAMEILADLGALVDVAGDGLIALEMLANKKVYHVILMDIQMPNMNGLDACLAIRGIAEYSQVPIIAMTANTLAEDIAQCKNVGMVGHITKPIDIGQLLKTLCQFYP